MVTKIRSSCSASKRESGTWARYSPRTGATYSSRPATNTQRFAAGDTVTLSSTPVPGGTSAAGLEDAAPDSPDASRAEEPRGRYLHGAGGVSGSEPEPCPVLEGEASLAGLALTAGGSLVQHQPRLLAYSDGPRHLEKINLRNQSLAKRRRDRLHHPRLLTYIAITRRRRPVRLVLAGFCIALVAFVLSLLLRYALLFFLHCKSSRRQFPVLQNSFSALARSSYSNTLIPGSHSTYFISRAPSLSLVRLIPCVSVHLGSRSSLFTRRARYAPCSRMTPLAGPAGRYTSLL